MSSVQDTSGSLPVSFRHPTAALHLAPSGAAAAMTPPRTRSAATWSRRHRLRWSMWLPIIGMNFRWQDAAGGSGPHVQRPQRKAANESTPLPRATIPQPWVCRRPQPALPTVSHGTGQQSQYRASVQRIRTDQDRYMRVLVAPAPSANQVPPSSSTLSSSRSVLRTVANSGFSLKSFSSSGSSRYAKSRSRPSGPLKK